MNTDGSFHIRLVRPTGAAEHPRPDGPTGAAVLTWLAVPTGAAAHAKPNGPTMLVGPSWGCLPYKAF